jgi:endonuclease/exonuclease/phosphatase family metal-dependent hydrolase
MLQKRGCLLFSALLIVALTGIVLWFYRRSFVNFVDASGPRYVGEHAPADPPFRGQLKVVSWNIRFGEAIDVAIEELRSVAVLQDADVLLLQEMDEKGVARIATALGYNYVYYPASIHNKVDRPFGNAVLSKWPMGETVKIVLPHASPHRNQRRIAVGATLKVDTVDVVAYSVHTEIPLLPNPWRDEQWDHLAEEITLAGDACIVVGGDFNTFTARSVQTLEERMDKLGLAPVDEEPAPSTSLARLGFRPDHFFVRGLAPLETGVWAETKASDHFPIWTVLDTCESE